MSLKTITEAYKNPQGFPYINKSLDYITDNKITNFSEWFESLVMNDLEEYNVCGPKQNVKKTFCGRGQIYCASNVTFNLFGKNVYKIDVTQNITETLSFHTRLYPVASEILHLSEKLPYYEVALLVVYKKLIDYKIIECRSLYACDKDIIKSTIDSTVNEFKSTSLLDLMKRYDICNNVQNVIKEKLLCYVKLIFSNESKSKKTL